MAYAKQLQKAAAKTAAAIKTQALQASGWQQLQKTCTRLGITLSLAVLGCNLSAQALNYVDKRPQTSLTKPFIELKGITGDYYTMKDCTVLPVYVSPNGKQFVIRANGRKYYPKSLNSAKK
jgi:hypothetical protein